MVGFLSTPCTLTLIFLSLAFFNLSLFLLSAIMAYHTRNRTRNNATQGSAFQELVVLPMFAPHLARLYRVPGTDIVYNTEFADQTQGI